MPSLPPFNPGTSTERMAMLHSHPLRIAVLFVGTLLLASPAYAGGGGWLIKPLGLMLGGAMLITLVLSKIQQTSILSFIAMGVVMGLAIGGYEEDYLLAHFPGLDAMRCCCCSWWLRLCCKARASCRKARASARSSTLRSA